MASTSTAPTSGEAAHLLLVEDDDGMRVLVTRLLRESGFRVTGCRGGAEMWSLLPDLAVDLVLLDVMLPGASGFDLLRALRARGTLPVIMLSARNEEADRVLGLELGADDYVAKPFGRPERLARIRAVLRRSSIAPTPVAPTPVAAARPDALAFAGWRLDLRSRALTDPEGATVDMSGAEHDLLLVFLEHPGRVLGRDRILEMSRGRLAAPSDRNRPGRAPGHPARAGLDGAGRSLVQGRGRPHMRPEMVSGHGHSRRGAARGWWAIAARMLALVLALSLVAPEAGYADDLAYHVGGPGHVTAMASVDAAPDAGASDPGLACHLHCGCHQAAPVTVAMAEPAFDGARPLYARLTETASSIAPDRLPRPPRA